MVDKLESGFTALEATVNDLLQFTAHREPNRQPCLIRNTIEEVCQSLLPQCETQGIRTRVDVPPEETIWVDDAMVRRALLNLVLNALDAMPDGGELVITSCSSPQAYELEVADSGPGVELQAVRKILEPFFTTKQGGTGLGLSIVSRIAEAHGGKVLIANCPEGGAAFTLRFPRQASGEAVA